VTLSGLHVGSVTSRAGLAALPCYADFVDRLELENAGAVLLRAVDSMSDGFVLFDADDRIILCNQVYASMLEGFGESHFDARSMIGMHVETIIRRQVEHGQPIPAEYAGDIDTWVADRLALHRKADGVPHVQQLKNGRWVQSIRHRMSDGCMVVLRSDVTHFKERERAAQMLAQHDALTGLPNRRLLHDRLLEALARARRSKEVVAVLMIDLDDFKPVNDTHGHKAGDEVLRLTADRLKGCLRSTDTVARFGGDEFVVIAELSAATADVSAVATKVIEAVARPIPALWAAVGSPDVRISCSIGISQYPRDSEDPDALIRLADAAMYQAKRR
jgi:diguanylate cyclase (GGDEF)-like protein